MQEFDSKAVHRLFTAIAMLKTEEECKAFFEDICTIKEVLDMAQRLEAAEKLQAGENYQAIAKDIGISTATISRVSRCLKYGSGGYTNVLAKLAEMDAEEKKEEYNEV